MRLALRTILRAPAYSVLVALTVALAISVSTAVLGTINAVLRPSSPLRQSSQLFELRQEAGDPDEFDALRKRVPSIVELSLARDVYTIVRSANSTSQQMVSYVEPNFFRVLGARASIGRTLEFGNEQSQETGAVVVSDRFWRKHLDGATSLANLAVSIDDRAFQIVGVAPPTLERVLNTDLWIASPQNAVVESGPGLGHRVRAVVRARDGSSRNDLERDLRDLRAKAATQRPAAPDVKFVVRPLSPAIAEFSELQRALAFSALAILLIACANLANLSLARVLSRESTFAIGRALGASKTRILHDVMSESVLLSVVGGIAGVLIVLLFRTPLRTWIPSDVPYIGTMDLRLDALVSVLAVGIALLIAVSFSLLPAFHASRVSPNDALKTAGGGRGSTCKNLYAALVVVQIALAVGMATGAAMMIKATQRLAALDLGYKREGLLEVRVTLSQDVSDTVLARTTLDAIVADMKREPGVDAASWWSSPNLAGSQALGIGNDGAPTSLYNAQVRSIGPDYLRVMGAHVTRGRDFSEGDLNGKPVAIVDERAARTLWPRENPLGRQIAIVGIANRRSYATVVGVVRSMRLQASSFDVYDVASGAIYLSANDHPRARTLVLRSQEQDAARVMTMATARALELAPNGSAVSTERVDTSQQRLERAHSFLTDLFGLFAAIALTLCALGLYSILTYATVVRQREYAVRLAVGASSRVIWWQVARQGLTLVLGGLAIGGLVSLGATRLIDAFLLDLYHVNAFMLATTESVVLLIGLIAVARPAVRAMRTNPGDLLRSQ